MKLFGISLLYYYTSYTILTVSVGVAASKDAAMRGASVHKKTETTNTSTDSDIQKQDRTVRDGLGENLPYPSVDYLGVGYVIYK